MADWPKIANDDYELRSESVNSVGPKAQSCHVTGSLERYKSRWSVAPSWVERVDGEISECFFSTKNWPRTSPLLVRTNKRSMSSLDGPGADSNYFALRLIEAKTRKAQAVARGPRPTACVSAFKMKYCGCVREYVGHDLSLATGFLSIQAIITIYIFIGINIVIRLVAHSLMSKTMQVREHWRRWFKYLPDLNFFLF